MKLGIGTYCYMWSIGFDGARPEKPMTALGLLEKARELGVKVVQVGPNLPLDKLPESELDRFVQQAREWDIELELCTRGVETEHLQRQIALCKRVGATLLRTIAELGGQPASAAQTLEKVRQILPTLQGEGVRLGLENGKMPALELRGVIEQSNSPLVGCVLDTVNSLAVPEGWRYVAEILAPCTNCLHVKEFVVQRVWSMMGFTCQGRPTGQGQLDVSWLLNTVKASRYDYNVILELWPPQKETLEETIALEQAWVLESVPYLRQFIKD